MGFFAHNEVKMKLFAMKIIVICAKLVGINDEELKKYIEGTLWVKVDGSDRVVVVAEQRADDNVITLLSSSTGSPEPSLTSNAKK